MIITRINKENEIYFLPMLHEQAQIDRPDVLRIGVTDDDKKPVGAVAAFIDHKEIGILSLYVFPDRRQQGFGGSLIDSLVYIAGLSGYESLSVYAENSDENEAILGSLGFELFESPGAYHGKLGEILRSEKLKKYLLEKKSKGIRTIASLDIPEKKMLGRFLMENRILSGAAYDMEYSTVCLNEKTVTSVMLSHILPDGMELTCMAEDGTDLREAFKHFSGLVQRMTEDKDFDGSAELRFMPVDKVFSEILASLEKNTGRIRKDRSQIHGVRML